MIITFTQGEYGNNWIHSSCRPASRKVCLFFFIKNQKTIFLFLQIFNNCDNFWTSGDSQARRVARHKNEVNPWFVTVTYQISDCSNMVSLICFHLKSIKSQNVQIGCPLFVLVLNINYQIIQSGVPYLFQFYKYEISDCPNLVVCSRTMQTRRNKTWPMLSRRSFYFLHPNDKRLFTCYICHIIICLLLSYTVHLLWFKQIDKKNFLAKMILLMGR